MRQASTTAIQNAISSFDFCPPIQCERPAGNDQVACNRIRDGQIEFEEIAKKNERRNSGDMVSCAGSRA